MLSRVSWSTGDRCWVLGSRRCDKGWTPEGGRLRAEAQGNPTKGEQENREKLWWLS